jgi:hypothetical protein
MKDALELAKAWPCSLASARMKLRAWNGEWSEINLSAPTWDIPGERTKNKSKHHVPLSLSAPAVAILRSYALGGSTNRDSSERLVFCNQPGVAISHMTFHTNMKALQHDADLADFRFHDTHRFNSSRGTRG